MRPAALWIITMLGLTACDSAPARTGADVPPPARAAARDRVGSPVSDPRAFALIPCAGEAVVAGEMPAPCILVAAGGKRFLFGAPAGAAASLAREDLRQLDAVVLFSLASADMEGLDEIRRASWVAGRKAQLSVYGPEGVVETVDALNRAHVFGDALSVLDRRGRGFNDIPLAAQMFALPHDGEGRVAVLTTGDVTVTARLAAFDTLAFTVRYALDGQSRTAAIWPCVDAVRAEGEALIAMPYDPAGACRGAQAGAGERFLLWPSPDTPAAGNGPVVRGARGMPVLIDMR